MDKKFLKPSQILFICCCILILELQAASILNIREKNGNQTNIALVEIKKITFSSGNILINKNTGTSESFPLNEIRYLDFSENLSIEQPLVIGMRTALFPNPAGCVVNLRFPTLTSGDIQIISLDGKIIYNQSIQKQSTEVQINVTNLERGLYICRIYNGTSTESIKFNKL